MSGLVRFLRISMIFELILTDTFHRDFLDTYQALQLVLQ